MDGWVRIGYKITLLASGWGGGLRWSGVHTGGAEGEVADQALQGESIAYIPQYVFVPFQSYNNDKYREGNWI